MTASLSLVVTLNRPIVAAQSLGMHCADPCADPGLESNDGRRHRAEHFNIVFRLSSVGGVAQLLALHQEAARVAPERLFGKKKKATIRGQEAARDCNFIACPRNESVGSAQYIHTYQL